jgi:MraZ protein
MSNPDYGYWDVTIEKSGRMRMPTELLKALPEDDRKSFWVTHGFGHHIMLWTSQAYRKQMDKLNSLNRNDRLVKRYRNAFLRNLTNVECDAQDRFVIPRALIEKYDIDKDIVLILDNGKIEIWSKVIYDEKFNVDPEELDELNEQIFSEKSNVVTEKDNE